VDPTFEIDSSQQESHMLWGNGDLFDYPQFVQRFKTFIESQCTTDYQKLTCLRRYLGTEPEELIWSYHMYADKTKAYCMAWERLSNTYGRTKCLKDKVKAELFKGPTFRETDYEALHKVKTYMDHFRCFFDSSGHLDQLNNEDVIHPILNRHPRSLRWKYVEKCAKNGGEETYEDLLSLVEESEKVTRIACSQVNQVNQKEDHPRGSKAPSVKKDFGSKSCKFPALVTTEGKSDSKVSSVSYYNCVLCNGNHGLWKCELFHSKTVPQRREFVVEKALCFCCLRESHRAKECSFKKTCQLCGKRHNTMLHLNGNTNTITSVKSDIEEKKKCDTPVVAPACGSVSPKNKPKKNGPWFNVVPVKVWGNNQNNLL